MKTLIIIRHGHALDAASDYERTLSCQGKRAIEETAEQIQLLQLKAPHIICSSANRAHESAQLLALKLSAAELLVERALYLAEPGAYIDAIRALPMSCQSAIVVGHNPGLSDWVALLRKRRMHLTPADYFVHRFETEWEAF